MSCREGEQTLRCTQLSTTTLCRALQSWFEAFPYHTEMHWVIHFLWPLNRKFSGLLARPRISSAVTDGTVFAWVHRLCKKTVLRVRLCNYIRLWFFGQLYKVVVFWATFIMYSGRYFYCSLLCAGNYILMQLYLSKLHIDAHQTVQTRI